MRAWCLEPGSPDTVLRLGSFMRVTGMGSRRILEGRPNRGVAFTAMDAPEVSSRTEITVFRTGLQARSGR